MTFQHAGLVALLAVAAVGCGSPTTSNPATNNSTGGNGSGGLGSGGMASGGVISSGGANPSGGAASGGVPGGGAPGSGGSGGAVTPVSCTFNVTPSMSDAIPTVGIVNWATDLPGVTAARIEFGLDTNYGLSAPVDLAEPGYRTLLLGMKAENTYHFRVVAESGANQCVSQDFTVETGLLANSLPIIDIETSAPEALAGGYMITGTYQTGPAYILDRDGDPVWWYGTGEVTRARMSYDGKHMWIAKGNVPRGTAKVVKVSMDGMTAEDLSSQFVDLNHDLVVLPDETVVYIAYDGNTGCDKIMERSSTGETREIIKTRAALGLSSDEDCHVNAIAYSQWDDSIVASELDHDSYYKVSRNGSVVWVLGGSASDFTGAGASWQNNHGLDVLALDRFLYFNNGSGSGSHAIEVQLDLGGMTATRAWEYIPSDSIANVIMGDVQRLWNGNTLVTFSTQGVVQEVNAEMQVLQEMTYDIADAIGYVSKRQSLYGPPPTHFTQ